MVAISFGKEATMTDKPSIFADNELDKIQELTPEQIAAVAGGHCLETTEITTTYTPCPFGATSASFDGGDDSCSRNDGVICDSAPV